MKYLLALLAAVFMLPASADAVVLIYSGSISLVERPESPTPTRYRSFVLFEPSTRKFVVIGYWRVGTEKVLSAPLPGTLNTNITTRPDGRTERVLSLASDLNLPDPDFANGARFFRGIRVALKTTTVGSMVIEPRVLSGIILSAALVNNGTDSLFTQTRITASYHTPRSLKANDANQTIEQARLALIDELNNHGYQ